MDIATAARPRAAVWAPSAAHRRAALDKLRQSAADTNFLPQIELSGIGKIG